MPKKEIRFGELVERAGKPEIVTPWTDPKQDRDFMKAVKQNRVVTLIQQPLANKKDFGEIGFHEDPRAAYLVFPKPLPNVEASRVVGIKYELMAEPRVLIAADKLAAKHQSKLQQTKPEAAAVSKPKPKAIPKPKPEPVQKNFTVIVRRVAVVESTVDVKARNKEDAKKQVLAQVQAEPFDTSKAVVQNQVKRIG